MPVVPVQLALDCMSEFETVFNGGDLNLIHNAWSNSVSFNSGDFADWVSQNAGKSDQFKIAFGIYTPDASNSLGVPALAGRLTAFVWAVSGNEDSSPFNSGELRP
jgi:hypothetical protein